MKANTNFFSIGELSSICNVSSKTLRYYDEIGLVTPEYKSEETGYRYYTKHQAFRIYIVRKLQSLDFCLTDIKAMLDKNDYQEYSKAINDKLAELDEKIAELENTKSEGQFLLEKLAQQASFMDVAGSVISSEKASSAGDIPIGEILLEQMPAQTYLSTVRTMDLYNNFEISIDRWFEIFRQAEALHAKITGNVHLRYHTDSPMDQFYMPSCELEVMLPVCTNKIRDDIELNDGFSFVQLPETNVASIYHFGEYDTIIRAHLEMMRWLKINNYEVAGPTMEEYLISPFDLSTSSKYLTKIIYPIRVRVK
ncbi:MAG: MerR family transcriptional regulator [Firmicutes bacterium]|nr:MerR family transcriptional regulator [Bacillota bacterium]